jgi:hypothetical protein
MQAARPGSTKNVAPQTCVRRPVALLRVEEEQAILRPNIAKSTVLLSGTRVATAGAMELYSAEIGVAK